MNTIQDDTVEMATRQIAQRGYAHHLQKAHGHPHQPACTFSSQGRGICKPCFTEADGKFSSLRFGCLGKQIIPQKLPPGEEKVPHVFSKAGMQSLKGGASKTYTGDLWSTGGSYSISPLWYPSTSNGF